MIEEKTVRQVLDRASIVDVVGEHLTLHRKGKDFVALCPFHDDSSPSLQISTTKNICKCFACGEGGTPVSFVMKYSNLTFPEAIKYLGRKYGIEVIEKDLTPEQLERKNVREKLINGNAFARDEFVNAMHQSSEGRRIALSYFRERGLTDETIKEFELGYSLANRTFLVERAKAEGVDLATLEELGLIMKTSSGGYIDRYRDRVIFPIHSSSGNVVGFGGRILKKIENVGKYINSPASDLYDKSRELYGLYFSKKYISKADKCIVLEGYMDVLSMYQKGVRSVVASSGTALTALQVQLIKRLTTNVTLLFDADAAGIKAALRGLDVCLEAGMSVNVLLLPEGEDPDSFAQNHTLEEINAYISKHEEDALAFKLKQLLAQYGSDTQGKAAVIEELAQSIAYINENIPRELYLGDLSERMEVSFKALQSRVDAIRDERHRSQIRTEYNATARQMPERVTNLSTKVAANKVPSNIKPPRLKDPLSPYELTLFHDIMDYGHVLVTNYTTSAGREGAYGIDLIRDATYDLREVGGLSRQFTDIVDQLTEAQETNPDLNIQQFLISRDNETINYYADRYLLDKYTLSPLHDKFVSEMEDEEEVGKLLLRDVLSLKLHIINSDIEKIYEEIKAADPEDQATVSKLYQELMKLIDYKNNASRLLGDRVVTPTLMHKN